MKKITLLAALILLSCAPKKVQAQTNVLAPAFDQQFLDSNGRVVSSGKLCTYAAGTTTPLASYKDSSGTLHTNPIILGSDGRLPGGLLFVGANSYKLELRRVGTDGTGAGATCPAGAGAGAIIKTWDNIKSTALAGGGWAFDGVSKIYPATSTSDVLVGASSAADCCSGNGRLEVVGSEFRILSDSTANSNMLVERIDNTAITFEERLNGTATHVPMFWRDGGNLAMKLDATAGSLSALTLGNSTNAGVITVVSNTSSSTYSSQGFTVNSGAGTSLTITANTYLGTATSPTPIDAAIPLYVKRASGNFAVFNDSAGSSGSLVMVTSSTSSTWTSSTTGASVTLHANATASSAVISMGVYLASLMSGGVRGFAVTDAALGNILEVDSTSNAATTGLLVWHNGTLQRVGLGAADSGGAGFRLMRVLN